MKCFSVGKITTSEDGTYFLPVRPACVCAHTPAHTCVHPNQHKHQNQTKGRTPTTQVSLLPLFSEREAGAGSAEVSRVHIYMATKNLWAGCYHKSLPTSSSIDPHLFIGKLCYVTRPRSHT